MLHAGEMGKGHCVVLAAENKLWLSDHLSSESHRSAVNVSRK